MSRLIREQYRAIQAARREKMREAMHEYDEKVFYPAMEALRVECGKAGHGSGHAHDNGLGWTFVSCGACGANIEKIGPED